jgi:hypothetical protein
MHLRHVRQFWILSRSVNTFPRVQLRYRNCNWPYLGLGRDCVILVIQLMTVQFRGIWASFWKTSITVRHTYLTYLLNWALLEKPPIVELPKNFPAFYGTRRFITVFTRALHSFPSWTRSIQSIPSNPILRSILVLSTHLCLGLPSGLFPSGVPSDILYLRPHSFSSSNSSF